MSELHGSDPEAGQEDLNGVLIQASKISMAFSGEVLIPESARTLQLLIDRAFTASSTERHVAA